MKSFGLYFSQSVGVQVSYLFVQVYRNPGAVDGPRVEPQDAATRAASRYVGDYGRGPPRGVSRATVPASSY
ncbi:hypothetical protein BSKO_11941 [Bryopsis sp. KO-2023]|nr:hypothetical protein BSKO_11941 [Bryopsis sp. KO-2023]